MSRIGREPITIPSGVEVTLGAGNEITVKGPLGTLCEKMHDSMTITRDGDVLTVTRPNDDKEMMNFSLVTVLFGNGNRIDLKISEDREKVVRSRLCKMAKSWKRCSLSPLAAGNWKSTA